MPKLVYTLSHEHLRPRKPLVTSPNNAHRQKHFDILNELADRGEWSRVEHYSVRGNDTYSKQINRYRDALTQWKGNKTG